MKKHRAKPFVKISYNRYRKPAAMLLICAFAIAGTFTVVQSSAVSPVPLQTTATTSTVSASTPCISAPAPKAWKHVVVLIFENKSYSNVIGSAASPYITSLAQKCGTYTNWKDTDYSATGTKIGSYPSKPNYATLTNGVRPSVSGIKTDSYATTSKVDNIFHRLFASGKNAKSYQSGKGGSCARSNFNGAYHDAMRYYTDIGGHSSNPSTLCNKHDVPISSFITDARNNALPAFSLILPTNDQNTHNNSISSGDAWAKNFINPFLNSASYKSGNTAFFFLWDEDTPIPNVLVAPSIPQGSRPVEPGYIAFSHYSALRTWQDMLGITPYLGDSGQAPSLLDYYNGN
jgi:phospholipase C